MSNTASLQAPGRSNESSTVADLVSLCRHHGLDERGAAALLSQQAVDIRQRVAVLTQITGRDYS